MAKEPKARDDRHAERGEQPEIRRHPLPAVYAFREEAPPRFNLRAAGVIALLLLALLLWSTERTYVFRLSAKELQRLEEAKRELERDMVFRFVDAPADEVPEERDTRFFSDADRLKKSELTQKDPPENDDPISRGDTFELENAKPPAPNRPAIAATPPQPVERPPEKADEALPDEPEKPLEEPAEESALAKNEQPREADADFAEDRGRTPLPDAGGPKPYRKMTRQEKALARERAKQQLSALNLNETASPSSSSSGRYDNPAGSSASLAGLSVETSRSDLGEYLKILRQLVKSNWRIPNIARFEVSGVAVVYFRLHQDGRITDARVVRTSSYDPLDSSSLNAIINTYKAPPLPAHIDEEWIPMKFGFYYNMRPRY